MKWAGGDPARLNWAFDQIAEVGGGSLLHIGANNVRISVDSVPAVSLDLDAWNHPVSVQGDGEFLPFRDRSFDVALLSEVLEHTENPRRMLEEACRVSRKLVLGTVPAELEWGAEFKPQHTHPRSAEDCAAEHLTETEELRVVRKCAVPRYTSRHTHRHFFDRKALSILLAGLPRAASANAGRLKTTPVVWGFLLPLRSLGDLP